MLPLLLASAVLLCGVPGNISRPPDVTRLWTAHGIFNVHKELSVCCAHEGGMGTDWQICAAVDLEELRNSRSPCFCCLFLIDHYLMIAYIALFSALEQTHCAHMWPSSRLTALACDSTWVTSFFIAHFWISSEVVYLQRWHGWCHMKLLPFWRKFCVHHTTMHHVTSCKATYVRCMWV